MNEHCQQHFDLVSKINQSIEEHTRMKDEMIDFQAHQKRWMNDLSAKLDNFTDEIDQELRGGKGPEGMPGMKQIMHDNKNDIAELKKQRVNWTPVLVNAGITLIVTVAAAVIIYLLIEGQGGV